MKIKDVFNKKKIADKEKFPKATFMADIKARAKSIIPVKKNIEVEEEHLGEKKVKKEPKVVKKSSKKFIKTGVTGFDNLITRGIPRGSSVLLCGGAGTGKTIFGLQTLNYAANNGEKCLYMSFEESEDRLREHMKDFGWNAAKLEKEGKRN